MKQIVIIGGPTATGKSDAAICLAKKLDTQIISCDSMQIYKHMDIGTAKITKDEMSGIKHHMIDIINPDKEFSAAEYYKKCEPIMNDLFSQQKIPIFVGGTGLYINSLMFDMDFGKTPDTSETRAKYINYFNNFGLEKLCELYEKTVLEQNLEDNLSDKKNPVRIIRALEIIESGGNKSKFNQLKRKTDYKINLFVLTLERQKLYNKINERVEKMIGDGLYEEVQNLYFKYGPNNQAFKAIGYKEFINYIINKTAEADTDFKTYAEEIKKNTRHYAKRQLTWFKRYDFAQFIDVENFDMNPEKIADYIYKNIVL